ncbi:MAG: proton-conducting transporter membrane subunit [Oscillospiraceae bacterium]|nr:proton-conducting transporter membrane subunit [Oscillospiraceae bacterium]
MNSAWLLLPVLFPLLAGAAELLLNFKSRRAREVFVAVSVLLTAAAALTLVVFAPRDSFVFLDLGGRLSFALRLDGLSMVFAAMVSVLWPIATFYSFEYMKHEGRENKFFGWFVMTFGVVIGIAFSANMLTLYLFYELLTLATLPLVMHSMDEKALYAGKKYLLYSMSGAALVFIGMVLLMRYGSSLDFVMGGVLPASRIRGNEDLMRLGYVLTFLGFGVKAAVFPLHGWLPSASVAPTPVSALLHAVAVVKAGVFAIIRLTYYSYGTELLRGSWAQNTVMLLTIVTILFGSAMALRTPHLKRRLAYSTVSNLSYILFGVTLMTTAGLTGGLLHMIFHAVIKITLFFAAGSILYKTHREYVYELEGFGRAMPVTMGAFTIASLALMGIPPLAGFTSKWSLGAAAVEAGTPLAWAGAGALIVSALLTALYLMQVVVKAYFPGKGFSRDSVKDVTDPNGLMKTPFVLLILLLLLLSLYPAPLLRLFGWIAGGIL